MRGLFIAALELVIQDDLALEWVEGFDLIQEVPTWVPLNAVVCPYTPAEGRPLFYASSNGLAAGNTLVEALCQALCEVLERDAESMTQAVLALRSSVDEILRGMGFDVPERPVRRPRVIREEEMPRRARWLLERIRRGGLRAYVPILALIILVTFGVFVWGVPTAMHLEQPGPSNVALLLSGLGVLTLLLFWTGLPVLLGAGGIVLGRTQLEVAEDRSVADAAVKIGAAAIVLYLLITAVDLL